jgi:hypothetical protein
MVWYRIAAPYSLESIERYDRLMGIGTERLDGLGKKEKEGFAICRTTELGKDNVSKLYVLYFSSVAADNCRDLLNGNGDDKVSVEDRPDPKGAGFACIGDYGSLNGMLK